MLSEGASFSTIKDRLRATAPTISCWKGRFLAAGIDALDTFHPGQPATVLTPALRANMLWATRKKPNDGSTHWSCRKLARRLVSAKTPCIAFDPLRRKARSILLPERITVDVVWEALQSKGAVGQMRQQHRTELLVGGNKVLRRKACAWKEHASGHISLQMKTGPKRKLVP
jgi:hypothetical protein